MSAKIIHANIYGCWVGNPGTAAPKQGRSDLVCCHSGCRRSVPSRQRRCTDNGEDEGGASAYGNGDKEIPTQARRSKETRIIVHERRAGARSSRHPASSPRTEAVGRRFVILAAAFVPCSRCNATSRRPQREITCPSASDVAGWLSKRVRVEPARDYP
jgi:hypothetical protein